MPPEPPEGGLTLGPEGRSGTSGGMRAPGGEIELAETTPLVALAENAERETGEIMRNRLERMAERTVNRDGRLSASNQRNRL